jgi:hypothetical protein
MSFVRRTSALAAGGAALWAFVAAAGTAAEMPIPTYTAKYQALYKGHKVGSTEFRVSYDAANGTYSFTNATKARGLLKLARPHPAVDRSTFRYADGRVVPLEFWYEDGSRKGEDNLHMVFDWHTDKAVVTSDAGRRELPLAAGTLDRASVQVALMLDLRAGREPGPYHLADDDSIDTYRYERQGNEKIDTPYGNVDAVRVQQQAEGSSRTTYIWAAPSLQYLPIKIEQHRDGEVLSAFLLESVEGLDAKN